MKRFPAAFYREIERLREGLRGEYNRDKALRSAVVMLIRDYEHSADELYEDAADAILDRIEKEEANSKTGMLPLGEHVALGDKQRCPRRDMTLAIIMRRDRVIDINKAQQDASWAVEKAFNRRCQELLAGRAEGTTIRDVLPPE